MQYGREGYGSIISSWVRVVGTGKYAIGRGVKYTEGKCVVGDMQYENEEFVILQ